ncbi:hypothetical protein FDI46_gp113 [Aeromonas phage AS-gz]|uniref:Uncharacterized protein n=1 Tax=Aeromonas phage AS-gz TaxID=2026082 RepID=A0A223LGM8_9CAUD|nr:hypothetical protein FDI46_gp113 [Aeromonas phage AS-gz]ASU00649.1 hypothetical protein [Aeromonas phage AS-gz]
MKLKLKIPLSEYQQRFCKTEGQRLWASMLELKSKSGELQVLETMPDGTLRTNVTFLGYNIGIPLEEQRYFEFEEQK